jgi:putative transposase
VGKLGRNASWRQRTRATDLSILVVLFVPRDDRNVPLALRDMGAKVRLLDDLMAHGMAVPKLMFVDGAPSIEKAIAALWPDVQSNAAPCTRIATT